MTQKNLSKSEAEEVERIEKEVERYLASCSGAADTPEGVVRWWIMQQRVMESERLVRKAIQGLYDKGKIEKRSLPDGRDVFYSRNHFASENEESSDG